MEKIIIPGMENSQDTYIKSESCRFKPKIGAYNLKIGEEWKDVDRIEGVIVNTGFIIKKGIGVPTTKKSIEIISNDFSWGHMPKNGENTKKIKLKKFERINGKFNYYVYGSKYYQEIKKEFESGFLFRTIFLLSLKDFETMVRVEIPAGSTGGIFKKMLPEMANWKAELLISKKKQETEYGEFFRPDLNFVTDINFTNEQFEKIKHYVLFTDKVLNEKFVKVDLLDHSDYSNEYGELPPEAIGVINEL